MGSQTNPPPSLDPSPRVHHSRVFGERWNMRRRFVPLILLLSVALAVMVRAQDDEFGQKRRKVVKSDQEWAKILTRNQFLVCRMKVTEPAFSGRLLNNHAKGYYRCVCCDADLFTSRTKFNSGTGWPSFWQAS